MACKLCNFAMFGGLNECPNCNSKLEAVYSETQLRAYIRTLARIIALEGKSPCPTDNCSDTACGSIECVESIVDWTMKNQSVD